MAKSTKAQEVSTGTADSYTPHELTDELAVLRSRPMLGGELTSAGTNSSQSSLSAPTSSAPTTQPLQAPAPTTENLSGQQGTEANSSADLTAGDGLEELSQSDKEIITPASAPTQQARVTSLADDDDFANM